MPPRGSSWSKAKYDRCVAKVKRRGGAYNPYAVCSARAKRSRRVHRNPAPGEARERFHGYRDGSWALTWHFPERGLVYHLDATDGRVGLEFGKGDVEGNRLYWRGNTTSVRGTLERRGVALSDAALRTIGLEGRLMLEAMLDRAAEHYAAER